MHLEEQLTQEEQESIKPVKNYAEAFKSRVVILLCLQYAFWSIGVYGFVMWLPSILKAAPDMSIVKTGWLAAVPYIFAIIGMFLASYFSDKTLNRKGFVWPFLLTGAIAFYSSYLVGSSNFWFSFVLLVIAGAVIYTPYAPFFTALTEILPGKCCCRSYCTDQQLWSFRFICRFIYCRLPERCHRRLWCILYFYGGFSFPCSFINDDCHQG